MRHGILGNTNRWRQNFVIVLFFELDVNVVALRLHFSFSCIVFVNVVAPAFICYFLQGGRPPDLSDQRGKKHYDWNKVGDAAKNLTAHYKEQILYLKKRYFGKVLISFEEEFANNVQRMLPNHWATRKGNLAESLWGFFSTQFWQRPLLIKVFNILGMIKMS